jgi:hypothetical protein
MAKLKQITVAVQNRPGALAEVANILGEAGVNIVALLGLTSGAKAKIQLVVDGTAKAKRALDKAAISYTEGALEQFELENKPGALAGLAAKLTKKGINIDCVYGTVPTAAKKAVLLMTTSIKAKR